MVTGHSKTFEASSKVVGGAIRAVLLKHSQRTWAAYFSTDVTQTAEQILEAVADRWAIEEHFHDVKEVWGAGEQQVRNLWSNTGCWYQYTWLYTLVELECWEDGREDLVDPNARPYDNPDRRA